MLQILRNKAQSTFIQVIVVIIALVFIFWGVGTNMNSTREVALTVNDDEVSFQQFQEAYDQAIDRLSSQFGGTIPKGMEESLGIKQQVIEQLIQTSLLRQGAREMGIRISAEEIRDRITAMPQFLDNGQFSMDRYQSLLSANRYTPTTFEASLRYDLLSDRTVKEIARFVTTASAAEIEDLYNQAKETVTVRFIKIPGDSFQKDVKVDQQELQKWYDTVKDNYRSEPEIKLQYLLYAYAELGAKISIDDKQVENYYQENIEKYKIPEQRRARHILLAAREEDDAELHLQQQQKANEILTSLQKGADFATAAEKYSDDPSKGNGGDLGFFQQGSMVPEFDAKVFAMQPGEISPVVKTVFGYHIIKLEEIKPPSTRQLADVRDEIVRTLRERDAKQLAFQLANQEYEGIIKAGSLKKFIDAHPDITLRETAFFSQKQPPAEIGGNQKLLDAAFKLSKGELSSLIETDNGYAVLFAMDRKEAVTPALADVMEKAQADFIASRSREMARDKAKSILDQLQKGKTLEQAIAGTTYTIAVSGDLGRNAPPKDSAFPASLLEQAIRLSKSAPLPEEVGEDESAFYVFVFDQRKLPTEKADEATVQQYRTALIQYTQQQLLTAWVRNLESQAKITRHKSL